MSKGSKASLSKRGKNSGKGAFGSQADFFTKRKKRQAERAARIAAHKKAIANAKRKATIAAKKKKEADERAKASNSEKT